MNISSKGHVLGRAIIRFSPVSSNIGTFLLGRLPFFLLPLLFLSSCNEPTRQVAPVFQGIYSPKAVQMTFGNRSTGQSVDFAVDHVNRRIYNLTPLEYGTKLDSAYLLVYLTNQVGVTLTNESTGVQKWAPGDTAKISVKGGRLKLRVERAEQETLEYDMRIRSYGYDPNKLTWQKMSSDLLPQPFEKAKILHRDESEYYYVGQSGNKHKIYKINPFPLSFVDYSDAIMPEGISTETLLVDDRGVFWGVTDDGTMLNSKDFRTWDTVYIPGRDGAEKVVNIFADNSDSEGTSSLLSVVTQDSNGYYFRTLVCDESNKFKGFTSQTKLPDFFPVRGGYVYHYVVSGIRHSNVFGGVTVDGLPTSRSFFTSDGLNWAETPYTSVQNSVPEVGGLFIKDPNVDGKITLVGGYYDGVSSSKIKISTDRGITWTELKEDQLPPADFTERAESTGFVVVDSEGVSHLFVIGGIIDGKPSNEIWHGFLDTTGGILNDFE